MLLLLVTMWSSLYIHIIFAYGHFWGHLNSWCVRLYCRALQSSRSFRKVFLCIWLSAVLHWENFSIIHYAVLNTTQKGITVGMDMHSVHYLELPFLGMLIWNKFLEEVGIGRDYCLFPFIPFLLFQCACLEGLHTLWMSIYFCYCFQIHLFCFNQSNL